MKHLVNYKLFENINFKAMAVIPHEDFEDFISQKNLDKIYDKEKKLFKIFTKNSEYPIAYYTELGTNGRFDYDINSEFKTIYNSYNWTKK